MGIKKKIFLGGLGLVGLGAVLFLYLNTSKDNSGEIRKDEFRRVEAIARGSFYPGYANLEIKNNTQAFYESGNYISEEIDERIEGKIRTEDLEALIDLFYENDFFSMDGKHYDSPRILDAGTTTINLEIGEKTYSVSEYANSGPKKLREINEKLWSLKDKIEVDEK